jgi:hypothetical protein
MLRTIQAGKWQERSGSRKEDEVTRFPFCHSVVLTPQTQLLPCRVAHRIEAVVSRDIPAAKRWLGCLTHVR